MKLQRPKILFIVGAGRSGTTLIDQALGQAAGFCSIGELNAIWIAGLVEGEVCGCGVAVGDCPFWLAVLSEAFGGKERVLPHELAALVDEHVRVRPRAMLGMRRAVRTPDADSALRRYVDVLGRMYLAVASVSGARVIIDSTKLPAHAVAACLVPSVDVYVLHVVRDPRAVAYSWLRNPDAGERHSSGVGYRPMSVVGSTAQWVFRSLAIEALLGARRQSRFMQLRYEDFAAEPAQYVSKIPLFLNEKVSDELVVDSDTVQLGDNHIIAGNRAKHQRGATRIKVDDVWKTEMTPAATLACSALAWPLMLKYGYPLRRPVAHDTAD